jgi:hypothetical protein
MKCFGTSKTWRIFMSDTKTTPDKNYVTREGVHYKFVREATQDKDGLVPLSQLADDEIVIGPGFVYRRIT